MYLPGATAARQPATPSVLCQAAQGAFRKEIVSSHEFLTGSGPHSKTNVTHSKQTTEIFLTGARTAFKELRLRNSTAHSLAGQRTFPF